MVRRAPCRDGIRIDVSERDVWATAINAAREALRVAYHEERRLLMVVEDRIKPPHDHGNLMEWDEACKAHEEAIVARGRAEDAFRGALRLRDWADDRRKTKEEPKRCAALLTCDVCGCDTISRRCNPCRRLGSLSGDPLRTASEDNEIRETEARLAAKGIDTGWEIVPRAKPGEVVMIAGVGIVAREECADDV